MLKKIITAIIILLGFSKISAQIDSLKFNIDLRTRAELDNGQKTLILKGKSPVATVYSRARFGIDYYYQKLEAYFSINDVRVWGETASSASGNLNLILNEAWAKYQFTPKVAVKIGRQIISYDDERLIGATDWAMQGRSFDAAKGIFILNKASKLEAVISYNNDNNVTNDTPTSTIYSVLDGGEKTKSMQILHYQFDNNNKFQFSSIAMNNIVQNASGVNYDMLTLGINLKKYYNFVGFFGSAYYQSGKNTAAQSKNAYEFSLNADFKINQKINAILGTEWLSGNYFNTKSSVNNAFSPLYGTNHKFNGFMDYFFAGNYFNSFGLNDYYLKTITKFNSKLALTTDLHAFSTNGNLGLDVSSYLGTELDTVLGYKVGKVFAVNLGHSFMFFSDSMKKIKAVSNPKNIQTWSWIALNFTPNFKIK